ncbi:MAG: hypothetical protein U0R50_04160 [Gaiellales bacterium]
MLDPDAYEERLAAYVRERAEEARAVRVGEKETSNQAAIVARYADLFTREQLGALGAAAANAADDRERLTRLKLTCEGGIVTRDLAARSDELENAVLAARLDWRGTAIPMRAGQARLATEPEYADRHELGERIRELSATFNDRRLELLRAREGLEAELSGIADPVERSAAEKEIDIHDLFAAVDATGLATAHTYAAACERWLPELLGSGVETTPSSAHVAWMRRLSPLVATYPKDKAVPVCQTTLRALGFDLDAEPGIRPDLEDRPQKSPRACVIAADPPRVVHLITRAQGGLHDYEVLLHEAGHALHYANVDPALPYTFRGISRDHALTEIYSFTLDALTRIPEWHALHFGLADAEAEHNAAAASFVESLMFRRYGAKLGYELEFWGRFALDGGTPAGYEERLTAATGLRYRASGFVADMDAGFYSADYLRAWIRAAQLRAHLAQSVGADWWRSTETGDFLRELFRQGTRPTSEEVAGQIGFAPLDTGPLERELASYR